jgi:hypothetical protein
VSPAGREELGWAKEAADVLGSEWKLVVRHGLTVYECASRRAGEHSAHVDKPLRRS